ncbi:MAG: hypothetical protein WBO92_04710, partial [Candidatus Moraniibacteriota bacterium]
MLSRFFLGVAFVLALPLTGVMAAEPAAEVVSTKVADAKMADTEITVTAFDILENDTVEVGFEIENRTSATADLRYRLEVVSADATESHGAADMSEYQTLSVAPHAVTRQRFSYSAPVYVGGTHELHLTVKSAAGFPLAGKFVGTATFTGVPIAVRLQSCETVNGKSPGLKPGDAPVLMCTLKSTAETEQTMFLTGDLALWGEQTEDRPVVTTDVVLEPGKEASVMLLFPALTQAGQYMGRVYLGNTTSRLSPPTDFVMYVAGANGHITRVELDRDLYAAGDTATVTATVLTTASSDRERMTVTATLTDGSGSACAAPVTQGLTSGIETLSIPVQTECVDPKVAIAIAASDGTSLDSAAQALMSQDRSGTGLLSSLALGLLFIGIVFLIALAVYLVSRQRKQSYPRGSALGLAFMIALGGLLSADIASASTLSGGTGMPTDNFTVSGLGTSINFYTGNFGTPNGQITITGPMRVSNSVSMPTDNFSIIGSGNRINFYTGNSSNFAGFLSVSGGTVAGSLSCNTDAWQTVGSGNRWVVTCDNGPGGAITFTDTAPPVCVNGVGPYAAPQPLPNGYDTAWCIARGYDVSNNTCAANCACTAPRVWNGTACAAPPVGLVNGVCGASSANPPQDPNRTMATAPSVNLCTSGTPSAVPVLPNLVTVYPATGVLSPAWSWTCNGSGGGTNATCWVFQSGPPPSPVTTFTATYPTPPQNAVSAVYLPNGGGTLRLDWSVTNAAGGSCTASAVPANAGWSGARPISGTTNVNVSAPTTFTLNCRNSSGTAALPRNVIAYIYSDAICPASPTLMVGDPALPLEYWIRTDGAAISCADPGSAGATQLTADSATFWSSTVGAVATVTGAAPKGQVTAISNGSTLVQVTRGSGLASRGVVASSTITVNAAPTPTYAICPTGSLAINTTTNPTVPLHLWRQSSGASFDCLTLAGATDITASSTTVWISNASGIATVSNDVAPPRGMVTAVSGGT